MSFINNDKNILNYRSKIEIVIPALDEEKSICSIIEKCLKFTDNILVVDGRSNDDTVRLAKEMGVNVVIQNGKGKGAAIREALGHSNNEVIVMLDADGSMRPEEIPLFFDGINSGADIVKGSRMIYHGGSNDITLFRRFGNFIFITLINTFLNTNYTDLCYGYMAFNKNAVEKLLNCLNCDGFNIEAEIIVKATRMGLKIMEIPSFELKRVHGKSKLRTCRDGFKILLTILKELFL